MRFVLPLRSMKVPGSTPATSRTETLESRLVAAARTCPVDERVPAGFARRVQRQLAAQRPAETLDAWIRGFRQALIPAVACLVVVICLQTRTSSRPNPEGEADSEAAEFSLWEALEANTGEAEL